MELTGKIKTIGQLQSFDSGFKKLEFVVETTDQYPQLIKFEVLKERAESFTNFNNVGDSVKVLFDIRGSEYNGKVYNNLIAWRVEKQEGNVATPVQQEDNGDLPF